MGIRRQTSITISWRGTEPAPPITNRSSVLLTAATLILLAPGQLAAQKIPRTPDGRPDLRGIWSTATLTPFERSKELAAKEFFTASEAADFTRATIQRSNRDRRGATPQEDVNGAYNEGWFDRGTTIYPSLRTSIVVDPADGRVPPLTPAARGAAATLAAAQRRPPDGPEALALPVRCLLWPTAGPPMLPGAYNNNYRFVETRDYVVIEVEMIHDARIIPLNRREHIPSTTRLWTGDSIGHWEGDTLVVDTTNFTGKTHVRGSDENLHVIERFTPTGPDTIRYRFTIDDPTAFTEPWSGEIVMSRTPGPIYEYACHEGNYSMATILSGARAEEKSGAEEAGNKSKSR